MTSTASWRRIAAAVLLLVLAGCTVDTVDKERADVRTAPPAVPAPRVLFQGQGPTHLLVGTAGLDGSGVTYPLDDLPGGDQTNPDWSPTGSHLVFVLNDGARDDLWTARADGSNPRLLLDCEGSCRYLDDPAWSPDGASVVYSRRTRRGPDELGSLETVDVRTGAITTVLPPRFRRFTAGARWSPYGSWIVYESIHTVSRRLDATVDGVALRIVTPGSYVPGRPLTDPALFAATADWSPDGTTIVYSGLAHPDSEAADLFVVPASGGEPRQVTHSRTRADSPTSRRGALTGRRSCSVADSSTGQARRSCCPCPLTAARGRTCSAPPWSSGGTRGCSPGPDVSG